MQKNKKIAIIGGGACGMISIAALKDEGFKPICFEASDRFGGLWNYREESIPGYGSLMSTTVINHSKEMGAFSDFPPKKECNNYMRHQELFQYLTEYYKHHDCERYIRFNSEVISVKKAEDYESTGRLLVAVKDTTSGSVSTDVFDGVVVATGHFNYPKMGTFPGLENFKGEVLHTHSLKTFEKFRDKKVLIIGAGCSGLDAVDCISDVAKQVYLSCRSGMFPFSRMGPNGYPIDYFLMRRFRMLLFDYVPMELSSWYFETFYVDPKFWHGLYYVKPKRHVFAQSPVINEGVPYKLMSGSAIQKGSVRHFTENGVVFDGEDTVTEIDILIMATGYTFKFPFLEEGLLEINNGRIDLYKCTYPVHLPHSSLVFVGFVNPFGPGTPAAEIQARWMAHIFGGKGKLPANDVMLKEVTKRHRVNKRRYKPSEYMTLQVDLLPFVDDIASEIGCKPNFLKYLFTDILLYLRLVFGPSLPYQYRLEGPHKWDGARDAIMTADQRTEWPLTRENRWKKSILQSILEYIVKLLPQNIYEIFNHSL